MRTLSGPPGHLLPMRVGRFLPSVGCAISKKVGCFLERHQQSLGAPQAVLERLRRMRPKQAHCLDRKLGGRLAPDGI